MMWFSVEDELQVLLNGHMQILINDTPLTSKTIWELATFDSM